VSEQPPNDPPAGQQRGEPPVAPDAPVGPSPGLPDVETPTIDQPAAAPPPPPPPLPPFAPDAAAGTSDASGSGAADLMAERPELAIGAAFAGGFVLAMILKRLAG
jgi:hypothetical protein